MFIRRSRAYPAILIGGLPTSAFVAGERIISIGYTQRKGKGPSTAVRDIGTQRCTKKVGRGPSFTVVINVIQLTVVRVHQLSLRHSDFFCCPVVLIAFEYLEVQRFIPGNLGWVHKADLACAPSRPGDTTPRAQVGLDHSFNLNPPPLTLSPAISFLCVWRSSLPMPV